MRIVFEDVLYFPRIIYFKAIAKDCEFRHLIIDARASEI